MSPPSQVLVFGTGSIGTIYGMIAARSGADVTCVCRSNYTEVKRSGLMVRSSILGDGTYHPRVEKTVPAGPFDYVLICTKATVSDAAELISPAVTQGGTTLVLLQNGIQVEERFRQRFPDNPLLSGVVYLPTSRMSPTEVRHTEIERLHIGSYPAGDTQGQLKSVEFANLLKTGGASVTVHEDIQVERWRKLVANAALNPLCALSRCRDVELLQTCSLAESTMRGLMQEVAKVAAAAGYGNEINSRVVDLQLSRTVARSAPGVEPSMLADVKNGRQTEAEAILRGVVQLAHEYTVAIPRTELCYVLLLGLNHKMAEEASS